MPKDKTATHEKIIKAAGEEFLNKGFEQASMRSIANSIGMSAAGLYRHFVDKETLFTTLVQPALDAIDDWSLHHKAYDYQLLEERRLEEMWEGGADINLIKKVVYPNFKAFKLLLCCSDGTRYVNFIHEMVMLEQEETIGFMNEVRKAGIPVKDIKVEELHLLLSAYVTALFEVVVHDFSEDEAVHYLDAFERFFCAGWRAFFGL